MRIEIHKAEQAEPEALQKAIDKVFRQSMSADHIEIHCKVRGQRDFPQWLEYTICFYMDEEDKSPILVIGMIQRTIDAEFEFHS